MLPTWVTAPNGAVFINDYKKYVKGVMLVPPEAQNPVVTPAAVVPNAGRSPSVIIEGGEDCVSEAYSLIGAHDAATDPAVAARLALTITDRSYRRQLMNRAILANHIFGTPLNPFFVDTSLWFEGQQDFVLQFFNPSTVGDSTFRLQWEARKFQAGALTKDDVTERIKELRREKTFVNPFWLTSNDPIVLPASSRRPAFFTNSRDYFLILTKIMCQVITTGVAGDTQEFISFRLFDAKTDRPLQNQPVTLNTGTGTAAFPYVLPVPLYVEPVQSIRAEFTNLITDAPTEVFFTFHGVGLYVSEQNPWQEVRVYQPAQAPVWHGAP